MRDATSLPVQVLLPPMPFLVSVATVPLARVNRVTFRAGKAIVMLSISISYLNNSCFVAQPVTVLCNSSGSSPSSLSPIAWRWIDASARDKSTHRPPRFSYCTSTEMPSSMENTSNTGSSAPPPFAGHTTHSAGQVATVRPVLGDIATCSTALCPACENDADAPIVLRCACCIAADIIPHHLGLPRHPTFKHQSTMRY